MLQIFLLIEHSLFPEAVFLIHSILICRLKKFMTDCRLRKLSSKDGVVKNLGREVGKARSRDLEQRMRKNKQERKQHGNPKNKKKQSGVGHLMKHLQRIMA